MEKELSPTHPSLVESLPADSSWWTFFRTDLFGRNYAKFKGRASRREWWAVCIMTLGLNIVLAILAGALSNEIFDIVVDLFMSFYYIIPNFALMSRRCHDLNWSFKRVGYAYILGVILAGIFWVSRHFRLDLGDINLIFVFLTISVALYLLFFIATLPFFKGDRQDNRFGKNIY